MIARALVGAKERRGLPTGALGWRRLLGWGGLETSAGPTINEQSALAHGTVYACVRFLSRNLAALPLVLYRRAGRSREPAFEHPLYGILHRLSNDRQTAFQVFQFLAASLFMRGNFLAYKHRDAGGRIVGIYPIRWDQVTVESEGEELLYLWRPAAGAERVFRRSDVWHGHAMSTDGIVGLSPIAAQSESVGHGLAMQNYGARFFRNDARPGGVLTHPGRIGGTEEERDGATSRLRTQWEQLHAGSDNAHRVAILEEGMKWESIGLSAQDAQYLESRKFNRAEIAGWFGVPPHLIGDLDRATFGNIEQQSLEFVLYHLLPDLVNLEQSIARDLLDDFERDSLFVKFNVEGMLRGDSGARSTFYNAAIQGGWMTRNEAREKEDLNPEEGLDEFLVPLNMAIVGEDGRPVSTFGDSAPDDPSSSPPAEPETDPESSGKFDETEAITGSSVLNGAQVASIVQLVQGVASGTLGKAGAVELMGVAFGIDTATAGKIIGDPKPIEAPPAVAEAARARIGELAAAGELELRGERDLDARARAAEAFVPVYVDLVGRLVRAESREVRKILARERGELRTADTLAPALAAFYAREGDFHALAERLAAPAVLGLAGRAFDIAAEELAEETPRAGLGEFFDGLTGAFAARYTIASLRSLEAAVRESPGEERSAIETLLEAWVVSRGTRVAKKETVQQTRAAAHEAYRRSGVTLIRWRRRGSATCEWCKKLDGAIVSIEGSFVEEGAAFEAEGQKPFVAKRSIGHPPLHRGCDCEIEPAPSRFVQSRGGPDAARR